MSAEGKVSDLMAALATAVDRAKADRRSPLDAAGLRALLARPTNPSEPSS